MLSSGARLGPYEVLEPLGKGAMGEVYRARDTRLGREVAVKVLPEHTASSPDALARFEFEARAVAALNHPNILALHDVGAEAGVSYAVTELLEGETLRERLRRDGALAPRKALEVAVQLARGLAAAHARGIIHRDLKPENVFVTIDGRVKILDFGLALQSAAALGASAAETRFATEPGLLVGTLGYMAPEQARGEPATLRSDVFSFGLVVYELATGTNPFIRETIAETVVAIMRQEPESLARVSGIPASAARLIDRCLQKRQEDRPESMRDLAFALEAASEDSAQAARVAAGATQAAAGTPVSARPLVIAAALVLLMTLAIWGYVRARGAQAVGGGIAAALGRAERLVLHVHQDRLDRLQLNARLVASLPQLKALFETDAPTIRDSLQYYQQRVPGTSLLIGFNPQGDVLARTDEMPAAAPERGKEWLAALGSGSGAQVIAIDGRPYHAAASSAEATGTVFGYVLAAEPVDDSFALALREITQADAVLLDEKGILGSSLRADQVPWDSLSALRAAAASGTAAEITIGATTFAAREVLLAADPAIAAVVLISHDTVAVPTRGIQNGILAIGAITAVLILAAAFLVPRFAHRR